jgi:hypothetical protein
MKINIISVPTPSVKSFTMFAKPDIEKLRETKTIRCSFYRLGKTRISTDMQIGDYCVKINSLVDGYKLAEKTEWNIFSGVRSTSYFFVISKKQNFEQYKEYLKEIVSIAIKHLNVELDELTVELEGNF